MFISHENLELSSYPWKVKITNNSLDYFVSFSKLETGLKLKYMHENTQNIKDSWLDFIRFGNFAESNKIF